MARSTKKHEPDPGGHRCYFPPSRTKLIEAVRLLPRDKDVTSITWAQITQTAAVNEKLTYRHFRDCRNLLHELVKKHFETYYSCLKRVVKGIEEALDKLGKIIWSQIDIADKDCVLGGIFYLGARSYRDYFQSEKYQTAKRYGNMNSDIIKELIAKVEVQDNISPKHFRQVIL